MINTIDKDFLNRLNKSVGQILVDSYTQMTNRSADIHTDCEVVKKHTWKDIVRIDDKLYCEEFPISGEMDGPDTYCIGDFMKAVAEKHDCDTDDIETYMLDNIEFDPSGLPFGAEACGCYINGMPEWVTDGWTFDGIVR